MSCAPRTLSTTRFVVTLGGGGGAGAGVGAGAGAGASDLPPKRNTMPMVVCHAFSVVLRGLYGPSGPIETSGRFQCGVCVHTPRASKRTPNWLVMPIFNPPPYTSAGLTRPFRLYTELDPCGPGTVLLTGSNQTAPGPMVTKGRIRDSRRVA